jgi:hypothetical protein
MPNNKSALQPTLDYLARLEAVLDRHRLAATTPKERCISALCVVCIQAYRRKLEASGGEEAIEALAGAINPAPVRIAPSPVGASFGESEALASSSLLDDRPDVARAGHLPLDPTSCPSEIPNVSG